MLTDYWLSRDNFGFTQKCINISDKIYAAVTNEMKVKNAEKMDEFFAKMARDESFRIDNLRIWELNLYPLFGAF